MERVQDGISSSAWGLLNAGGVRRGFPGLGVETVPFQLE